MKSSFLVKQITAIVLATAILFNCVPLLHAMADGTSSESDSLMWTGTPLLSLDFEENYTDADGADYYDDSIAENWSANNSRGSHSEMVTEDNGNTAVRLTYDTQNSNENYNANAVMNIYNPETKSKFVGTVDTKYTITFDYKVEETDGNEMQIFIAPSNREYGYPNSGKGAFHYTDMGPKATIYAHTVTFTPASDVINSNTDGWVTVSVDYTALAPHKEHTVYPIIVLQTNNKTTDSTHTADSAYASVLIDNIRVSSTTEPVTLDFESECIDSSGNNFYDGETNRISAARGSHTEIVTEDDGNSAMRLTYDNQNNNYKDNPAFNIYNSATKEKFVGSKDTEYIISFDYKIEATDNKTVQVYVVTCGRSYLGYSDLNANSTAMGTSNFKFTPATDALTETTDGYKNVSVSYTGNGTDYPIILLVTNDSVKDDTHDGTRPYASVLIDNITVNENSQALITCYNYDGKDKSIAIYRNTTFGDLDIPSREGYIFDGWYTDADLTRKASNDELVCNYNAIFAKWSGDGTAMTPQKITEFFTVESIKNFDSCYLTSKGALDNRFTYVRNSMLESIGTATYTTFPGQFVFSNDTLVVNNDKMFELFNINAVGPASDTVMFYVELPDYEKSDDTWALSLRSNGIHLKQNDALIKADFSSGENNFSYTLNNEWIESDISADGIFTGLPSGYKGYIRIDFSNLTYNATVDFTASYTLDRIQFLFNAMGGDNGNMILGGVLYFPAEKSESTVMYHDGLYYELSKSEDAIVVNSYDAYKENGTGFSTRYTGTASEPAVKYIDVETSAFCADAPVGITTVSGNAETTKGYMTTYVSAENEILIQPAVDTFMIYVEMPEFEESNTNAGLKLLDTVIKQGNVEQTLNFSNSIYRYASVSDASWKIARAGADGDLFNIPSGFKGYIKFDIKDFKNIFDLSEVDFASPYYITKLEIGFNHIGGKNGNLVIGGIYSVLSDSISPFIKNGISGETNCFKIIPGDFDCDGTYNSEELVLIRKALLNIDTELSASAELRKDNLSILTLIRAKKVIADIAKADISVNLNNGEVYKDIFSSNVSHSNEATVYDNVQITDYSAVIEADTTLNDDPKALAFAEEINSNKIGDFEKSGIDKMCHVSTFLYAKGNIYMSYYANTISASENPDFQVARLAYAPEDNPSNKVIIDIMQVGDDLYGHDVTGVYDTILMQKEDEPDNLYILWTAKIGYTYYRFYRIFNMETEQLGEIGVNRFKVGDIVNDFSSGGMKEALTANNIGYKTFFSDIGIMQKLSSRVENGETYYYTGAYSGYFTCIIKSKDLITWEYVAQPNEGANGTGFENMTKWENAVYVLDNKVYYFVRQIDETQYGVLTCYDLNTGEWAKPVLVGDCQSRSDFIYYQGGLYLFYAPTDRNHIGILKINTDDIAKSEVVLQANMNGSCFYPFVQYNGKGELCMSYTVSRRYIRLASFTLSNYLE